MLIAVGLLRGSSGCTGFDASESHGEDAGEPVADADAHADAPQVDGTPQSDSGSKVEAGPGSCSGKAFQAPVRVGTADISGAIATTMWGLRVVGPNAYFAATPAGANEQQLFRATFTPGVGGSAPSLSNAAVISPPSSSSVVEWAPTVSPDSALLVFATAFPPPRDLAVSTGAGGTFAAAIPIGSINTSADETDPWLVGSSTAKALYFGRENGSGAMEIWRSAVSGTTFSAPAKLALTCAQLSCGTPVVTPDERTVLFASWASGGFVPNVAASALTDSSGGWTAGPAVGHPELGTHYPSWVSDDGCEVLLGGPNISSINDIYYARRTPE
ncbi:MAG: hypothetical protein JWP97_4429 [Labilithrix sp.]|nr:hypothetical protein [Labilithrix sp.]